jgi:hypothetical protein
MIRSVELRNEHRQRVDLSQKESVNSPSKRISRISLISLSIIEWEYTTEHILLKQKSVRYIFWNSVNQILGILSARVATVNGCLQPKMFILIRRCTYTSTNTKTKRERAKRKRKHVFIYGYI